MIYPDATVEEWCAKLGIEVKTFKCEYCRQENEIDTPFVSRDYIGFERQKCSHCGSKVSACSALINSKQEKMKWGIR